MHGGQTHPDRKCARLVSSLGSVLLCSAILSTCTSSSPPRREAKPRELTIIVEQAKRVSPDKAQFTFEVKNNSERQIYLAGYKLGSRLRLHPVFLEQWRSETGWKAVAPCVDVLPPPVTKLDPGQAVAHELVLEVPLPTVCKERNLRLEGKFRLRLEYFETEDDAQAYWDKYGYGSDATDELKARIAVSKPFEFSAVRTQQAPD